MSEEIIKFGALEKEGNLLEEYLNFRGLKEPIPTFKFVSQFSDWVDAKAKAINTGY